MTAVATPAPEKKAGRAPRLCCLCDDKRAVLLRPKNRQQMCKECFCSVFEEEIHQVIVSNQLFKAGERVAIGASGGKDSTVLAYVLSELNCRHSYGLDLYLLSVDEGITGYRDDSLETVKRNEIQYGLPLKIVSYKDLYGWTMDEIVKAIGLKNNCTFCGVFRRQALDRGAALLKTDKLVTGHNADDMAETVLLNILRGDIARLSRCTMITTGEDGPIPRCKPFKYTYEKEIVMYAYYKRLDYFSTEYPEQFLISSPRERTFGSRPPLKCLSKAHVSDAAISLVRSGAKHAFYWMDSTVAGQNKVLGVRKDLSTAQATEKVEKCRAQQRIEQYLLADHVVPPISSFGGIEIRNETNLQRLRELAYASNTCFPSKIHMEVDKGDQDTCLLVHHHQVDRA